MAVHPVVQSHEIRGPLWLIAVLMALALVVTAAWRWSGAAMSEPQAPVSIVRTLYFVDLPDGAIDVTDAASGAQVLVLRGEQGFVRGALRSLVRGRRQRGLGPQAPFELSRHLDGRLILSDPATGQRIDLEAFGPTNAGAFARLLEQPADARP
jgi:putative photosynthetic complex assembly protein